MEKSSLIYKRLIIFSALILALACGFFVFWYSDIGDTLDNGVMLAESIVKGEFLDYYEYAAVNASGHTAYSANYNVLLYALFALWNLPTVIIHMVTGFDYMTSIPALLWCKLIIVFTFVGIFVVVRKLTEKLSGNKKSGLIAGLLSVSSLCVFVPALVAVQYDCISLFFMILGIYFYTDNKLWLFLLMFAIAIPLKLFAIFIFIPMVLIRFKNVPMILSLTVLAMIPSFVLELPFRYDPYFTAAMDSQNGDAIDLLLGANVSVGDVKLNLFIITYITVCFLCYLKRENDSVTEGRLAVYFSFAVFGAFCILVPIRSYWVILYTPFLSILAALKKNDHTVPIIADTLAGLGGGFYFLLHHWIYNTGNICNRLVLGGIAMPEGTVRKYSHIKGLFDSLGMSDFKYVFFAIFAGAIIFSLWYLYPQSSTSDNDITKNTGGEFWAMLSRPAILLLVFAVLIFCNFASEPDIKFGSDSYSGTGATDLMSGGTVSRYIQLEADEELSELTVYFDTSGVQRSARAFIGVRLVDDTDDSVVWEDSMGIAVIEDGKGVDFDLEGLSVNKNKVYRLEVYGIRGELAKGGKIYPHLDSSNELAMVLR